MPSPEMKLPEQNPATFKSPTEHEMEFEDVYVTTKDHIKLHGWFIKTEQDPKSSPTIIFFHANAGNIGFRLPNIVGLVKKSEVNVLIVGYRGYGHSQGKPTEADLKMDTQSVFDWALEHEQINNDKIYLFGRSLGGAVATYLASKTQDKIKGLILENTFTSIPDMVDHIFKYLSALKGLILRIEWNSLELIKELKVPILFISGQADQLIPPFQMQTLYSNAKKSVKTEMMEIEHGTHNESWMQAGDVYFHRIKDFCHEK
eukprot:CAMPEP_0196999336 /NCGR_PEP_ID=MMETSP1380-20130617/4556_1 /TAXON_ID=5936 /ORGANISM="Euplotes crassus, Strain CT5" /LENGTH=258 /DNA_ID=CAMNT_0042416243 /DNA_START=140 /DNA_END=916 /DNA_ORIENTATION=+